MTTIDPTHSALTFTQRAPRPLLARALHKAIATENEGFQVAAESARQ